MTYTKLATKVLFFNYRQYRTLFLVCAVGVCIMLSAVAVADGMIRSAREKARQYYGGDLQLLRDDFNLSDPTQLIEKIRPLFTQSVYFFSRFDYDARNASIFFEGESIRQRIFKGVDFETESELFEKFTLVDGDTKPSPAHNTMLISQPIAQKLGVRAGDSVTVMVRTIYGHTNTMTCVISGIFQDSSLFGMYTSYLDIRALRTLTSYADTYVNRLSMYYPNGGPSRQDIVRIQKGLEDMFTMFPLTDDKVNFYNEAHTYPHPVYALIPLDANIKDLEILVDAIKTMLLFITIILMVIIAVGIGSTYRVIAMKRITEIGTYRALGMTPSSVQKLFLTEASYLLFAGFLTGIIMSIIVTTVLAQFNFSFIPAFDIFLIKGHLVSVFHVPTLFCILAIIAVTTLLSVLFTIRNIVHISPVGALATTA